MTSESSHSLNIALDLPNLSKNDIGYTLGIGALCSLSPTPAKLWGFFMHRLMNDDDKIIRKAIGN